MIQRPQTLLLFLTAVLYGLMAFAPLWQLTVAPSTVVINATMTTLSTTIDGVSSIEKESSNVYLLAACACGVILSIVIIFLFKNRALQAKISALNALIIMIFVGLNVVFTLPTAKQMIMSADNGEFQWGFYLAIGVIISIVLTNKLIRKDEALVKSVDRIR